MTIITKLGRFATHCLSRSKVEKISSMGDSEVFRRVDLAERERIEEVVKALPGDPAGALGAFKQGDYEHPIFQNGDWSYYAIRFVLKDELSTNDFAKIMLYLECDQIGAAVLDGGEAIRRELIRSFLITFADSYKKEDVSAFFDSLDETDQIFAVPRKQANKGEIDTITTPFDGFRDTLYVLPPPTLQKFFNALSGGYLNGDFRPHTNTEIHPVVGFSRPVDFEYDDRRDVWIPCPGVSAPELLHEVKNPSGLGIYIHDAYFHCFLDLTNPHRKVWNAIAKDLKPEYPQFYEALLDRDFEDHYLQGADLSRVFNNQLKDIIYYFENRDDPSIFARDRAAVFYKIYEFLADNPQLLEEANITLDLDDADSSDGSIGDSSSWTTSEESA